MQLGAFMMPSHPPERPLLDGIAWDLAQLRRLDALGFAEAWIGEHFTAPWEPCPAPDLLIAQALSRQLSKGEVGLIVNLEDQKLFNLNPDFLTYTVSKIGLHGLTPGRYPLTELVSAPYASPSAGVRSATTSRRLTELSSGDLRKVFALSEGAVGE